ncbi:MAG TPA: hypothetical protein VN345_16080 [Blastocatellia bacterium]|jgi:hypothetical protein|nr:hypothetical protein [Blastocatellia bacterium]
MKTTLSLFLAILSTASLAPAQSGPYTPRAGSVERKGIMDAARIPVEAEFKKKIVFKVDHLKVDDQWAFMVAIPQQQDGKPAYVGTPYEARWKAGGFSNLVCVLLRKQNSKWRIVTYSIGPTDVVYEDWDRKYKAPSAIFKPTS